MLRQLKTVFYLILLTLPSAVLSDEHPRILVIGDSISAAYGLDENIGWVNLMRQSLREKHADVVVTNASLSGDTTGGGLQRLPNALEKFKPTLVIIELGGNDGLRGQSLKTMRQNLTGMVKLVQQSGASALLLGMRIPTNYGAMYTERFFQSFQTVADETNTPIVPFLLEPIAADRAFFQPDGVHPTAEAQPLLMALVLEKVESLLAE